MRGDELIHIMFGDTVNVESIPVSTEGINDIICVAVSTASVSVWSAERAQIGRWELALPKLSVYLGQTLRGSERGCLLCAWSWRHPGGEGHAHRQVEFRSGTHGGMKMLHCARARHEWRADSLR